MVAKGDMLSHEDVIDVLSVELLGLVPMDDQVVISTNMGMPLVMHNTSPAGQAFRRIAKRLNGETDLPIKVPTSKKGMWNTLSHKLLGLK